jgi:dipeptidase
MLKKFYFALMVAVLFGVMADRAESCTNYLVSKGASTDGSIIITYNADAGGFMEPLFYMPAMDHEEGTMIDIYEWDTGKLLGQIPQVAHTYRVVGNMNEHQVVIGETTFTGHKELKDTLGLIDYGSLMYLALQRAKTAQEAIKVMIDLCYTYGYYSTGESFSVGDKNEVWILEIIGRGPGNKGVNWVARKVPDGYVCAHANQSRIHEFPMDDPENTWFNEDVIDFAIEKGYYDPDKDGEFSYCDAYCPLDPGGALYCEGRVWHFFTNVAPSQEFREEYWRAFEGEEPYPLFVKPDKKLSVRDIMGLFRNHFEGTPYDMTKGLGAGPFGCPYRWKPLQWQIEGDSINKYGWGRPVSTQQTAFSYVSQARSWLPDEIGGVFWYGVDDNYTGVYTPLYSCMQSSPEPYTGGSIQEFSFESAFWVFNLVANLAYTKYSYVYKDIEPVQKELEDKFFLMQPTIEKAAAELYKADKKLAIEFLSDYSINSVEMTMERWQDLWKYLVVKYNDGYINDVTKDGGRHPKGVSYGDEYLKKVLKERPGYYDVKWKKKGDKIQ